MRGLRIAYVASFTRLAIYLCQNLFHLLPIWIRLYGLPVAQVSKQDIFSISSILGEPSVISSELVSESNNIFFVRAKITLNISKPLVKTVWCLSNVHGDCPVHIHYEGLPTYCFSCGCVGHREDIYPLRKHMIDIFHARFPLTPLPPMRKFRFYCPFLLTNFFTCLTFELSEEEGSSSHESSGFCMHVEAEEDGWDSNENGDSLAASTPLTPHTQSENVTMDQRSDVASAVQNSNEVSCYHLENSDDQETVFAADSLNAGPPHLSQNTNPKEVMSKTVEYLDKDQVIYVHLSDDPYRIALAMNEEASSYNHHAGNKVKDDGSIGHSNPHNTTRLPWKRIGVTTQDESHMDLTENMSQKNSKL